MPRGGARVGAGRKPSKPRPFQPTIVSGGKPPAESDISQIPPEDLPAEQRDFWHRYAGLAIEKRTLTMHTAAAFRLLCELDAEKRATKQQIDRDGRTFTKITIDVTSSEQHTEIKAHPLMTAYGRLSKHVEALMARFGLAPFGKAEQTLPKRQAVNPWAKVAEK